MKKSKLRVIELIIMFVVGTITMIFSPPIPLLAIPFVFIIGMRSVFMTLEDLE